MKKILSVFLIIGILLILCGCEEALTPETTQHTEASGLAYMDFLARVDLGDRWIEYAYNDDGLLSEIREGNDRGTQSLRTFHWEEEMLRIEYYSGKDLTSITELSQKYGDIISRSWEIGNELTVLVQKYRFNSYNCLMKLEQYQEGQENIQLTKNTYDLDTWQLLSREVLEDNQLVLYTEYSYDDEGRLTQQTDYDSDGQVTGTGIWEYGEGYKTLTDGAITAQYTYGDHTMELKKWVQGEEEPVIHNIYSYEPLLVSTTSGIRRIYNFIMVQLGLGYGG